LERVADRLEREQDCYEWSDEIPRDSHIVPCYICRRLSVLWCQDCMRPLCAAHTFYRRQERDPCRWNAVVLCEAHAAPLPGWVCEAHATPLPGWVCEPFSFPDEEVPHDARP
jgi:hypothetical protein